MRMLCIDSQIDCIYFLILIIITIICFWVVPIFLNKFYRDNEKENLEIIRKINYFEGLR